MNIQEIELLLSSFNKQAGSVREQLTDLLVAVSDGRVPSVDTMSAFNTDIVGLRSTYDGIYEAARGILGEEELPEKGSNINNCVSAVKNSRIRVLKEQIAQTTEILTKFLHIKSELDIYTQALKPFQEAASKMLTQINEETIGDILPETDLPETFLKAMSMSDIGASAEGLTMMRKISQHYPLEVQMGLMSKKYTLEDVEQLEDTTAASRLPVEAAQADEEEPATPEESSPVEQKTIDDTNASDDVPTPLQEKLSEEVDEPQPVCETAEDSEEPTEDTDITQNEPVCQLNPVNKLKTGVPSASSFKKDIAKIVRVNPKVCMVLPLLTNLGVLTKRQCYMFGVCLDCNDESEQAREAINSAVDSLAAKGYLACFEYEADGEMVSAYCLSNYCSGCMRKESIMSQTKKIWELSCGNYRFPLEASTARSAVEAAIYINDLLVKYLYTAKDALNKKEFAAVKESICWKDGYYQITVYEDGIPFSCRLLSKNRNPDGCLSENVLICDGSLIDDMLTCEDVHTVFELENGTIYRRKGECTLPDEPPISDREASSVIEESQDETVEEEELPEQEPISEGTQKVETDEPEPEHETVTVVPQKQDEKIATEDVAATPKSLLEKKTIPTDEEFCKVALDILNTPTSALDQLKSAVVNAVLLAHGAGLLKEYEKSQTLSLQLRLATNLLIKETDYTSEKLATAFSEVNEENSVFALAAYMLAMLTPAIPFDYGFFNQTETVFEDYELYFSGLELFKPLFNKLMSVKDASATGFSPSSISLLGSDAESKRFVSELRKQATQYLTVRAPKTRMRALPVLYRDCFDKGSDLNDCMSIVSEDRQEELEIVQIVLAEFCDVQNGTYTLNDSKIEENLESKWNEKNDFKLAYDARSQAVKQFRIRLEVMQAWVEHTKKLNSDQQELQRLRVLKEELLNIIQEVLRDNSWKLQKNANVLVWMLRYMQKYLSGEFNKASAYSDLLFTGVISLDDSGLPVIDETTTNVKYYEPWRNALRHITMPMKSADELKAEICGDILSDNDEEDGLKDNLHQLQMLGKFLHSDDEEYIITEGQLDEAKASANECTTRFKEKLELAYTYNQINETEKETLSGIMNAYQDEFYELGDFAAWRRFLDALEMQIHEFASGRKIGLREKLDFRLKKDPESTLLIEADRLLEEEKNFAVTEEYITRFDGGETELEDELDAILHDKDYFGEFLSHDIFDVLIQVCRNGKGRALKTFGWEYAEKHLPDGWTTRNRENSRTMLNSWPLRRDATKADQVQTLFKCLGFNVVNAVKKQGRKEELYQISVKPTDKSMADYRHPIAAFGTQVKRNIDVVMLYGTYTDRQLVDTVSSLDLGGISIVLVDQPIDAAGRRHIGEIFHTQTSGQNPFLLIDQVLFLYLAMHQETERLPALLKCTLPYTTYQPFVRDGGSTADEMFCGRTQELATIIDPNGACVVYGGRQLGKTALLERAESRCSKPENKEYAVYSTIIRMDNELDVVETLIADIEKKTDGKIRFTRCSTLKEMCDQLSKQFRNGQIASMHLLIDEVDCFLASIADEKYKQIQPLVDLKRETKNKFKFVLTGLHNVCRAKNATRENGIFGQLGTPLCIKPLSPTDALKLLSRPLNYLGFQIERYPHLETILTNTNYYPGILQFFGYMLVETLTGQYTKYYHAADGNPPFTLRDEQLGAVMNSADLNKSIKDKFRWSLELDPRYFMIARCITMLYHLYEEERTSGSWMGFQIDDIREIAENYQIHCLENESAESFSNLMDEMVEMGILSKPAPEAYRLRRSSFVDIIGENMDVLERDILNYNEVCV